MVYYGFWYTAKMDALMAFIREAQKNVDGEVTLNLYKGNVMIAGRTSPKSLYDEGIASMEGGRQLQPDRCGRVFANSRLAAAGAGQSHAAELLNGLTLRVSAVQRGSDVRPRKSRPAARAAREPAHGAGVCAVVFIQHSVGASGRVGLAAGAAVGFDAQSAGSEGFGQFVLSSASTCWRR